MRFLKDFFLIFLIITPYSSACFFDNYAHFLLKMGKNYTFSSQHLFFAFTGIYTLCSITKSAFYCIFSSKDPYKRLKKEDISLKQEKIELENYIKELRNNYENQILSLRTHLQTMKDENQILITKTHELEVKNKSIKNKNKILKTENKTFFEKYVHTTEAFRLSHEHRIKTNEQNLATITSLLNNQILQANKLTDTVAQQNASLSHFISFFKKS